VKDIKNHPDKAMLTQENPVQPADNATDPDAAPFTRSEAGLLELIRRRIGDLITGPGMEGDLAPVEVTEKARTALRGLAIGAAGLVLLLCGGTAVLLSIGFAVSGALEQAGVNPAFSHALGFLFSGLAGAFAGWVVIHQAKTILSPANLAPSRTTATLHRAFTWVGSKFHLHHYDDHEQNSPSP